jgi:O-antigen ligase
MLLPVIAVALYGFFQHFGISAIEWKADYIERVFSTFGQPNWLAQYLAMLLPLILYFAVRGKSIYWSLLYLLAFSSLWFTYSVSGILGFGVGLAAFVVIGLKRKWLSRESFVHVLVLMCMSLLVAVTNPGIFKGKIRDMFLDVKDQLTEINRAYAQEDLDEDGVHAVSDPGFIRFGLWRGALDLIRESPKNFWIGTGPETYPYEFQFHRPKELNYSSEWDYVFNKPHNYYLELWAELGIIGLASYLALIVWSLKKAPSYLRPSLAAFYTTNFFGWPVVATSLIWWVWLGILDRRKDE